MVDKFSTGDTGIETATDVFTQEDLYSRHGNVLYKRKRMWTEGQTVDTNYTDSLILDARFFRNKIFHIINSGAQSLVYQVYACIDPDNWQAISEEETLTTGNSGYEFDDAPWTFYKIKVKASASTTIPIIYVGVQ